VLVVDFIMSMDFGGARYRGALAAGMKSVGPPGVLAAR
jgi:hypothetical protein